MFTVAQILKLADGGLFASADQFDLAVRRLNQDLNKLVILARRNRTNIHHICLLQARENSRVSLLNKGKKRVDRLKPRQLCKGS